MFAIVYPFSPKLLMIIIFSLLNTSPYIVPLFYNPSPHFWYLFWSPSNIQVRDFLQVSSSEPWAVSSYLRIGYSKSHVEGHEQGWWMVSFLVGRMATWQPMEKYGEVVSEFNMWIFIKFPRFSVHYPCPPSQCPHSRVPLIHCLQSQFPSSASREGAAVGFEMGYKGLTVLWIDFQPIFTHLQLMSGGFWTLPWPDLSSTFWSPLSQLPCILLLPCFHFVVFLSCPVLFVLVPFYL